jgi:hypothetical protein
VNVRMGIWTFLACDFNDHHTYFCHIFRVPTHVNVKMANWTLLVKILGTTSDGHTFVYSLLRYRYSYIVSNGRY